MKLINSAKTVLIASILGFSAIASATQYEIKVTGSFDKDPSYSSSFGITSASAPVDFSIVVDDTLGGVMVVPANTVLSSSGDYFDHDVTLISTASIVSTNITLGNTTWTKNDFLVQPLKETGSTFHILLDGRLDSSAPSQAKFALDSNGKGFASASFFICNPVCSLSNQGDTYDYTNGSTGLLSNLAAALTNLTPPPPDHPACTALDALIAKIEALGLKPAVKELVLAKIAANARNLAEARQHVQKYINIIKSLRGNKLKPALADLLILLGKILLLSLR